MHILLVSMNAYPSTQTKGMPGDKFYIVERGRLGAYKRSGSQVAVRPGMASHTSNGGGSGGSASEKPVAMYKSGDYFGELSLLRDEPRAATVRNVPGCKTACPLQHAGLPPAGALQLSRRTAFVLRQPAWLWLHM
eukprot:366124-Chlamydomonas_euryale.AAC.3